MRYEVKKDGTYRDHWLVEAINFEEDGEVYTAMFYGPDALLRATEYVAWKERG